MIYAPSLMSEGRASNGGVAARVPRSRPDLPATRRRAGDALTPRVVGPLVSGSPPCSGPSRMPVNGLVARLLTVATGTDVNGLSGAAPILVDDVHRR